MPAGYGWSFPQMHITPLFFPGGDIAGHNCGTVMMPHDGAQPPDSQFYPRGHHHLLRWKPSCVPCAACEAGVSIIAADTKVTEKASQMAFITRGFGFQKGAKSLATAQLDAVLVSGPIGNHGIAVMQARGNLGFQSEVRSDTAPLNALVWGLCQVVPSVHVLRDPTRGGLATTLAEIAMQSQVCITLEEAAIPIDQPVRKACELLGLDPLYLANEGKMIIILPEADAPTALSYLRARAMLVPSSSAR